MRQLTSYEDDVAYFTAIEASRPALDMFAGIGESFPSLTAVTEVRRLSSSNLRMGIWNERSFVGAVTLSPHDSGGAVISYWVDSRFTNRGFATVAVKAITSYGSARYCPIYALVHIRNGASIRVLVKAGFKLDQNKNEMLTFEFPRQRKLYPA